MKALKLANVNKLTKNEWLNIRKQGITGTRIAGILKQSPWETPRSVYLDLIGDKPEKEQTESMYWGTVLEEIVAKEFSKRNGIKVRKVNYILQHPVYNFLLANIDRLVVDKERGNGVLEIKTASAYSSDEWKEGAPRHYYIQLQFYLAVTGLKYGYLVALIGGQKYTEYMFERDETLVNEMIEAATEFWYKHVQDRITPDVTELDTQLLNGLYQAETDKQVYTDDSELITFLTRARNASETADKTFELAKNQVKDLMKDAEVLMSPHGKVATWKANKNGSRTFKITI